MMRQGDIKGILSGMARPDLSYLKNLLLVLFGLPLGLLTGLTGMAASVLAVPAVRNLLGLRPERAVGVGLAVTFFAAFASLLSYTQHGLVRGGLALLLFVGQTIGALLAERVAARFPVIDRMPWLWGTLVVLGGLTMTTHELHLWGHTDVRDGAFLALSFPLFSLGTLLLAAGVGLLSRFSGLGGVLLVPALIYVVGFSAHTAQGTALVVLALASLPGMLIHARRGDVSPQAATWLSVGAVFGALSGALLAVTRMTDHTLLVLFGGLLTVLGLQLLWRRDAGDEIPPNP